MLNTRHLPRMPLAIEGQVLHWFVSRLELGRLGQQVVKGSSACLALIIC